MIFRPANRLWPVLALSFSLAACGFHLAGDRPLPEPLKSVHLELIDSYHVTEPPLQDSLQTRLVRRGAVIKGKREDAQAELRLFDLREGREVLSYGTDGKAIEYRLISRVSYELRAADGTVLVAPETQAVTRDYSFNAQLILPKEAEERRLRNFIQDELAGLVLLRIEAQLRALTPVAAAPVVEPATTPAAQPTVQPTGP